MSEFSGMDPKIAREFLNQFPELHVRCWYCEGKGKCQSLGGYSIVDCWHCFGLGQQPDIIKMVNYLLEKKNVE